jgi:two-component system, OmpR family, phosphate regulon response regulator OmpR
MSEDLPHVLVVDDDNRLRDLLRRYLVENGFVVTVARDAADARARLAGFEVDLIVLDVMMPEESGLDLTRDLRRTHDVPILLLTARGGPDDRIAGLEAGADDYLAKPFEPRELVLRINSILRRVPRPPVAPAELRLGTLIFNVERDELREGDRPVHLTQAEAALLRALAAAPGTTLSREDLVGRIGIDGGERAVDVQVTRLRRKIEPDPREPRYLQTVRGEGYMLRPDG